MGMIQEGGFAGVGGDWNGLLNLQEVWRCRRYSVASSHSGIDASQLLMCAGVHEGGTPKSLSFLSGNIAKFVSNKACMIKLTLCVR